MKEEIDRVFNSNGVFSADKSYLIHYKDNLLVIQQLGSTYKARAYWRRNMAITANSLESLKTKMDLML